MTTLVARRARVGPGLSANPDSRTSPKVKDDDHELELCDVEREPDPGEVCSAGGDDPAEQCAAQPDVESLHQVGPHPRRSGWRSSPNSPDPAVRPMPASGQKRGGMTHAAVSTLKLCPYA